LPGAKLITPSSPIRPLSRCVIAGGARLHCVEGRGLPLRFLDDKSAMLEDFLISGVIDLSAHRYRAIAFDCPVRTWRTVPGAAGGLPARRPFSYPMPSPDHPHKVAGLVLVFDYYPAPRREIALFSAPVMSLLGDILNPSRPSLAQSARATETLRQSGAIPLGGRTFGRCAWDNGFARRESTPSRKTRPAPLKLAAGDHCQST
jgi:hypothetical protein